MIRYLILPLLTLAFLPVSGHAYGVLWSRSFDEAVMDIAIDPSGSYIAVAAGGKIYFLNESGSTLWKASAETSLNSVAISSDGSSVLAGDSLYLYRYNKSGNLTWRFLIGDNVRDLAVTPDGGYIALASSNSYVYLFQKNGSELWRYRGDGAVLAVDISPNGQRIAAGTNNGTVYLLGREGSLIRRHNIKRYVLGLTLVDDGVVAGSRFLRMLDAEGERWYYIPEAEVTRVGYAWESGRVTLSDETGVVYILNSYGNLIRKYDPGRGRILVSSTSKGYRIAAAAGKEVFLLVTEEAGEHYINFTSPREDETISGVVTINATITYPYDSLVVRIDGNYACPSLPCNWDTSASPEGRHNITIVLIDDKGEALEHTIEVNLARKIIPSPEALTNYTERLEETGKKVQRKLDFDVVKKLLIIGAAALVGIKILTTILRRRTTRYRWKRK
jgi:WD40 repeat protein